ncbi:MAG: TonB-dependent receptor, partial [Acidobacteriota bacterium]
GVDRRYTKGFSFGLAYTLGKSEDNTSDKRNVMFNTFDDTGFWGPSSFDRRHVLNFHYIYDLPFFTAQNSLVSQVLGGWQISGSTFMRTGTPLWVTRGDDVAGVGDAFGQPYNQVGDPTANSNQQFSQGVVSGTALDQNFWFNPQAFAKPAPGTFGNAPRNQIYNPGQYQWDIALFKNIRINGPRSLQFRAEMFNFLNHANLNGANTDPTSSTFGRITSKDGSRRDVQLSLRFLF